MEGKHIILGITGGIAAYKSVSLLRLLIKEGAEVQVVITPSGKEFITPVTLSALSGRPVISEFFTANTGEWHSHVDLGLWADLMIIAPATASTIGKMANGIADNMLVTTYLSAKEHVMIAPAMDLDMMSHPTTQRNLQTLAADGVEIIDAESGELASHLVGKGRMADPEIIKVRIEEYFHKKEVLKGCKVAITAGPTYEKIDPVRFIGNYSSGKMGFSLARQCALRGAEVTVIAGPNNIRVKEKNIRVVNVESAVDMLKASSEYFPSSDIGIFAAAVADYRPVEYNQNKIKRENKDEMILHLVKNPDLAATLGKEKKTGQIFVGFALETDGKIIHAEEKLKRKNMDIMVLNSLSDSGAGFGTDTNKITIVAQGNEPKIYPLKSKEEVASDILDYIVKYKEQRLNEIN